MSQNEFERAEEKSISHDEPDSLHYVVHHAELPETKLSKSIDSVLNRIGSFASWFWLLLMAVILVNVVMKNVFGDGRIEFEEIQWHIYAAVFMIGLSYTFVADDHVRVDLLYDGFSLRKKVWVDLIGLVVFLIPFILIMLWHSIPFVEDAIATHERSSSPAGLSHRWIIKSALPLGLLLLLIAVISRVCRLVACLSALKNGQHDKPTSTEPGA